MKSKTSYFNAAALGKDITRFAPAWGLYTLFLLGCLLMMHAANSQPGDQALFVRSLADSAQSGMTIVNLLYALLCAQLLFGDLYSPRLCNALHAMPLRREGWYLTHVLSGLFFSLVPTTLTALAALPLLGSHWHIAFQWLLGATMEFVFFYGLASFCALCVGNRFALALVYGMANTLSLVVYWLVSHLYIPLLYGVVLSQEPFVQFCPLIRILQGEPLLAASVEWSSISWEVTVHTGSGWHYLTACFLAGLVLLFLGLILYRRRKLEAAGDFAAFPWLRPVLLTIYTLFAGVGVQVVWQEFTGDDTYLLVLAGLLLGYFTGRMLLSRSTRVFGKRDWRDLGILLTGLALTFGLTLLDPLGVKRQVPQAEDIATITISLSGERTGGYITNYSNTTLQIKYQEDIEAVIRAHQAVLEEPEAKNTATAPLSIVYHYKDGSVLRRFYQIQPENPAADLLRPYFSSLECVMGNGHPEILKAGIRSAYTTAFSENELREYYFEDRQELASLVDAIALDCAAGNLVQHRAFCGSAEYNFYMDIALINTRGDYEEYIQILIYPCAENTAAWFKAHGITGEGYMGFSK